MPAYNKVKELYDKKLNILKPFKKLKFFQKLFIFNSKMLWLWDIVAVEMKIVIMQHKRNFMSKSCNVAKVDILQQTVVILIFFKKWN